ncbi:MAG: methyl-accepting chemotaxis protein [Eubacteriales bacterium]
MKGVVKLSKSLYFKLVVSLFICLGILMGFYTWYQCRQVRERVENDLESKGIGLAKAAAMGLQAIIENDIRNGVITKQQLFDRNYKLIADNPDSKKRKYSSAFDKYTDEHLQKYVDGFLVDNEVVFAIPVAYSDKPELNGYLPTHNTVFKDRSKRIFNDVTGAAAATTTKIEGLKQEYQRDTGEVMWDMSYPIYVDGQHWGGYRVAISIQAAEAKIKGVQKQTILIMVGILVLITATLILVTKIVIGSPLRRILDAAQNLASGDADLSSRLNVAASDELGLLAKTFDLFIEKIHHMVKTLVQSIDGVAETSDRLFSNSDEVAKASQTVALSIEEMVKGTNDKLNAVSGTREIMEQFTAAIGQIAHGANEQANHVNQTSQAIGEMAGGIQEVATNAQTVLDAAVDAAKVARKGEEAVESTISGMEKIKNTVYDSAVRIKELGEHSQKIGEIIQVIDEIAEQTNLLALNAAIEAARAGEHGKGFAVVADEVRKLAERSGKATKEIAELIINIQKGTGKAVDAMEHGTKEVEEGVRLAHDAGTALEEIMQTVEMTLSQIQLISGTAQRMSESSISVVTAIDNVAAITEQNSASTQEMAAGSDSAMSSIETITQLTKESAEHSENISVSVEEMAASTEDIAQAAETLSNMARDLRTLTKGFKI